MFSSLIVPSLVSKGQLEDTAGQAFNDPLSNVVYLGTMLSRRETLQQFQNGTYPIACLGPFLHEGTHHRCFDTPTGYALLGIESFSRASWWQTLKCRAPRNEKSECGENSTCFNRALLRAIYRLLTPLAEGLALYGELDSTPGSSPAASAMLLNAVSVFFYRKMVEALSAGNGTDPAFKEYKTALEAARTEESGSFARTHNILERSEATPSVEPYRKGYRFIGELAAYLHRHSSPARDDLDVTLGFLCSFFFDDWIFASMIAAASWRFAEGAPSTNLDNIAQYLATRTAELRHPRVAVMFDQYASALATNTTRQCDFLHYTQERHESLSEFSAQAGATELYWQAPKTTKHRHIFRVATMVADTVTLDVSKGSFSVAIDGLTIDGPALRGGFPSFPKQSTPEAHQNETAVELLLVRFQLFACVFYKGSLIAVLDRQFRPIDPMLAEEVLGDLSPFVNAEYWRRHHWKLLNPNPDTTCGAYLENRLQRADELTSTLYT